MLGVWRLQLLREISRRGSIKAAAEAMSISPSRSASSMSILEREAGVQLLEKTGRRVRLTTPPSSSSVTPTRSQAHRRGRGDLASMQQLSPGRCEWRRFPTAGPRHLPDVMTALSRQHPALRVTTLTRTSQPAPKPTDASSSP